VGTSSTALVSESRSNATRLVATALALAPLLAPAARDGVLEGGCVAAAGAAAAEESLDTRPRPREPLVLLAVLPPPVLVLELVDVVPLMVVLLALVSALMLTEVEALTLL
jgi:hypothetical protein